MVPSCIDKRERIEKNCKQDHIYKQEQTRAVNPILVQCWISVTDGGPFSHQGSPALDQNLQLPRM